MVVGQTEENIKDILSEVTLAEAKRSSADYHSTMEDLTRPMAMSAKCYSRNVPLGC